MVEKIETTIEIISHATEDPNKIVESFFELFEIPKEEFSKKELTGHFENPITVLNAKISKKKGKDFFQKLISKIPKDEIEEFIDDIENRIQDSTLHMRVSKQDMIMGIIRLQEKDVVKLKIFTPIYRKKDIVKTYVELLRENI
jgi:hypothetical protein